MLDKINSFFVEVTSFSPKNHQDLEDFRIRFVGKKGVINALFLDFKTLTSSEKKAVGKTLNNLKTEVSNVLAQYKSMFESNEDVVDVLDMSRPSSLDFLGSRHPLSLVKNEIVNIFSRVGFVVSEGPEIEDDWHNFTALNLPLEHPARDMQDSFFIEKNPDFLLRTHTSSVQVRYMETTQQPPIRTISPGRVYRNEAVSARAHCIFHQVEGLYIDKDVSFADLKQMLLYFAKEMFGEETKIRLRPSYFPFTEPSAEVDVSCNICQAKGCSVCKQSGYLEILGCGMVDPSVLKNCNINPNEYSGYAFGMGIERIAMLKYNVNDLRLFFENDIRFLKQFTSDL